MAAIQGDGISLTSDQKNPKSNVSSSSTLYFTFSHGKRKVRSQRRKKAGVSGLVLVQQQHSHTKQAAPHHWGCSEQPQDKATSRLSPSCHRWAQSSIHLSLDGSTSPELALSSPADLRAACCPELCTEHDVEQSPRCLFNTSHQPDTDPY